jgi:hypothetical protein
MCNVNKTGKGMPRKRFPLSPHKQNLKRKMENMPIGRLTTSRFLGLLAAILLLAPWSVFAMDPISDSELDELTGQAGISIFQEGKPSLTVSFTTVSWGDNNGIPGHLSPGYLILDGLDSFSNVMPAEFVISMKDAVLTMDEFTASGTIDFNGDLVNDMTAGQTAIKIGLPYILWNSNLPNVIRVSMNGSGTYSSGDELIELRLANFIMNMSSSPTAVYLWPH